MTTADVAVRLASLHESPAFRAERFDDGPAFEKRVAVLPSAFNPPTRAHVALLELACAEPDVSSSAALLSTSNVDKQVFGAPLAHRIGMLLALAATRPWMAVIAANAARLIDQGSALLGAFPGIEFDFVVGYDTLVRVFDPRYYDDFEAELDVFFNRHRIVAANRAQATADAVADFCGREPARRYRDRILVRQLDSNHAWVSSTAVRTNIGRGEPAPALLPEVEHYIQEHGLYGEGRRNER